MNESVSFIELTDGEQNVLEYARLHNLAFDHLVPSILNDKRSKIRSQLSVESLESDLDLPQFPPHLTQVSTDERLPLTKEAAMLLKSIQSSNLPSEYLTPLRLDARVHKRLKQELPLLTSDHKVDVRTWMSHSRNELKPGDVVLPVETPDDEKGESLQWPSEMWERPNKLMRKIGEEKKQIVKREELQYLQDIMRIEDTDTVSPWDWDGVEEWKRVSTFD